MKRILLLCFIHGFKGSDNTFGEFPQHLQETIVQGLSDVLVTSVVYPKYETRGELAHTAGAFLEWLKERVIELRKEHLQNPWPPNDRKVGVILVAHSMGGFVASDCLLRILNERRAEDTPEGPIFPFIQGILTFDTPFNGLARSMFVYGAFSNYQKVSSVFDVMTALSAATPAALSKLALRRTMGAAANRVTKRSAASSPSSAASSKAVWKTWQLIALRTGTVGAIAAGGVIAYNHRQRIVDGLRSVRCNLRKTEAKPEEKEKQLETGGESLSKGTQTPRSLPMFPSDWPRLSMSWSKTQENVTDALGQGLAYINRSSVGASLAWLSDHFTFVGTLLRQNELDRRLKRLTALLQSGGVGVCDVYVSLGENGYWSGGYFVPERTFCAVPSKGDGEEEDGVDTSSLFVRQVIHGAEDELAAHLGLFKKDKNKEYEKMTKEAAKRVVDWFNDERPIQDDVRFAELTPAETEETEALAKAVDAEGVEGAAASPHIQKLEENAQKDSEMQDVEDEEFVPDESPIDIAAAASLVPLPITSEGILNSGQTTPPPKESGSDMDESSEPAAAKAEYMRYLLDMAQQTGLNLRLYLPSKLPRVSSVAMPKVQIPSASMPSMPNVSLPSLPAKLPNLNPFLSSTSKQASPDDASPGQLSPEPTDGLAEQGAMPQAAVAIDADDTGEKKAER